MVSSLLLFHYYYYYFLIAFFYRIQTNYSNENYWINEILIKFFMKYGMNTYVWNDNFIISARIEIEANFFRVLHQTIRWLLNFSTCCKHDQYVALYNCRKANEDFVALYFFVQKGNLSEMVGYSKFNNISTCNIFLDRIIHQANHFSHGSKLCVIVFDRKWFKFNWFDTSWLCGVNQTVSHEFHAI